MRYLAIASKKVVDVAAVEAVMDEDGQTVLTPAEPEVSHMEVDAVYVEDDPSTVARNLAGGVNIEYHQILISEDLSNVSLGSAKVQLDSDVQSATTIKTVVERPLTVAGVEIDRGRLEE